MSGGMHTCRLLIWCITLALLVGCGAATPTPVSTEAATPVPAPPLVVTPLSTLPAAEATAPIRMQIPAIGLVAEITPMAWQVTLLKGERQAVWQVPLETVGWHINSARAGMAGNVVVSGHHLAGEALFAPLAAGQAAPGQEILLTDEQGRIFVYEVVEVSPPISASGGTEADQAQMAAHLAPTDQAQLTLVTGWPQFADTHYLVVVAELQGVTADP
jgi:sortase (surface protein transpeptidase)